MDDDNNNGNGGGVSTKSTTKTTTPKKRRGLFGANIDVSDNTDVVSSSSSSSSSSASSLSSSSSSKRRMTSASMSSSSSSSPISSACLINLLPDEILVNIFTATTFAPSLHLVCRRWHQLYFSCFMLSEKIIQSLERRFLILNPHPIELLERANVIRRMFVRLRQIARSRNCRVEQLFLVTPEDGGSSEATLTSTPVEEPTSTTATIPSSSPTATTMTTTTDPFLRFKQRLTKLRYPVFSQFSKLASPKNSPFTSLRLDYSPYGIAFDEAKCNLFVVDSDYDRVLVYHLKSETIGSTPASVPTQTSPTTSPSTTTTTPASTPARTTPASALLNLPLTIEFCRELMVKGCPTGVAFNSINGNLIITCRGDQAIREFDPNKGILIRHFRCGGHDSSGRRGLSDLRGVALDTDGSRVYVADYLNNRIQVFTNGGNLVQVLEEPLCHALDIVPMPSRNQLLASNYINHCLEVFDIQTGKWLYRFGSFGTASSPNSEGKLNYPNGVAVDPLGNILVCDTENHRIQVFDDQGRWLHSFGSRGSSLGQFEIPHSIAASLESGFVYIGENGNQRIQIV